MAGASVGTGVGVTTGVELGTALGWARGGGTDWVGAALGVAVGRETAGVLVGAGVGLGVGVGTVRTTGGGRVGRVGCVPGPGGKLKCSSPGIRVGAGAGVWLFWAQAAVVAMPSIRTEQARMRRAVSFVIIPTGGPLARHF
ncbi:hypothetical protein GCM10009087_24830 [Sphingomonas oligophenolica]